MLLIDSSYLHENLLSKQVDLMKSLSANGALDEFRQAVNEYQQQHFSHAINEAAKSVESTLKFVLGNNLEADLSKLLKELGKGNLIPPYYNSFFDSFFKIVQATGIVRNKPGNAHGQGTDIVNPPKSLAEFEINLAATVNKFLLECYTEKQKSQEPLHTQPLDSKTDIDEIPF
jgi:small-conductance mechanosensitive channel